MRRRFSSTCKQHRLFSHSKMSEQPAQPMASASGEERTLILKKFALPGNRCGPLQVELTNTGCDGQMSPSEKFRKFSAECQAMAKLARSAESKATWGRLAGRWVQCRTRRTPCFGSNRRPVVKATSKPWPILLSRDGRLKPIELEPSRAEPRGECIFISRADVMAREVNPWAR